MTAPAPATDDAAIIADNRAADRARAIRVATLAEGMLGEALDLLFHAGAPEIELGRLRAAMGSVHGARLLLGE